MSEREPKLTTSSPEQPQISFSERVSYASKARKDLEEASSLYEKLWGGNGKLDCALQIADAQISLGLVLKPTFEEVKALYKKESRYITPHGLGRIAGLQARMGDFEEALKTVSGMSTRDTFLSRNYYSSYGYLQIAEAAIERGIVPNEYINKARKSIPKKDSLFSRVHSLLEIAKVYKKAGLSPKEILDSCTRKVKASSEKRDAYCFRDIAKAYADFGLFKEAIELVPQIKLDYPGVEETEKAKKLVITQIAIAQTTEGLFDEASQIMEGVDDLRLHAYFSANSLFFAGKKGLETQLFLDKAVVDIKSYEQGLQKEESNKNVFSEAGSLWSFVAEAQNEVGNNPLPFLELAINSTFQMPDNDAKVENLIDIAKARKRCGLDFEPFFKIALEAVDRMGDTDYIDVGLKSICYQDVGKAALAVEYFDLLETVFERFDKHDGAHKDLEGFSGNGRFELLLNRAKLLAEKGLSKEEIEKLTEDEVHRLITFDKNVYSLRTYSQFMSVVRELNPNI